jgi:hypothetical protein
MHKITWALDPRTNGLACDNALALQNAQVNRRDKGGVLQLLEDKPLWDCIESKELSTNQRSDFP